LIPLFIGLSAHSTWTNSSGDRGTPCLRLAGGRPKLLGELQELARQHVRKAIVELARLALKARSETARIAAVRELLDRGYGRPRQAMEVSIPADNPLQLLLDEIDAQSRIEPPVSHTPDRSQLPPGYSAER
jgi:CRP-like cAMP-binding protein